MLRLSLICIERCEAARARPSRWRSLPGLLGLLALLACGPAEPSPEPRPALRRPDPAGETLRRELVAMGSPLSMRIRCASRAEALEASEAAYRALSEVESRLSTWTGTSELARANRSPLGEPFELSPETAEELQQALGIAEASGFAFSPFVGPLVDTYDLRGAGRWPTALELQVAALASRPDAFRLSERTLWRQADGARLEEGGWAKGAGLDAALDSLRASGVLAAQLDLGGQVALLGPSRVALRDPRDPRRVLLRLELADLSIAISDNSLSAREADGRPLPHLLDPSNQQPAADWGSLAVISTSALAADALSTGLFVLGPARAIEFAAAHPELSLVLLEPTNSGWRARLSPALFEHVQEHDPAVLLEPL